MLQVPFAERCGLQDAMRKLHVMTSPHGVVPASDLSLVPRPPSTLCTDIAHEKKLRVYPKFRF